MYETSQLLSGGPDFADKLKVNHNNTTLYTTRARARARAESALNSTQTSHTSTYFYYPLVVNFFVFMDVNVSFKY